MDRHAVTPDSAIVGTESSPASTTALVRAPLPADRHPALVYLAQLSPGSRRTMRTALNTIAELLGVAPVVQETSSVRRRPAVETLRYCDWASLRYQHTLALRTLLAERYKPATANKMLAALRRVLLEARRLGLMSPDDYAQAADIAAIKGSTTYLDGGAAAAIADWLAVRGAIAGPLLCPVNKAGKITIRRLSDQAVLGALQKRATQATVKGFSPHDLRRTFISDLLDAGADIATVQRMAGHASPETTSRYDRRGEATKRRAASLLHLAYDSRTGGAQ